MLNENQLSTLFDSLKELFCLYDTDLNIQWANKAAADSLDLKKEDMIGKHCYEFWNKSDLPCPDCPVLKALRTGLPQIIEKETPDGRHWQIQGFPVFDKNGIITNLVEFGLDITEIKNAENKLKGTEEKYKVLFQNMQQGAFYQRYNGEFVDVNTAALQMFGLTRDEFMRRNSFSSDWKVIREDGTEFPTMELPSTKAMKTGKPVLNVTAGVYNPKIDDYVWMSINAIPQFEKNQDKPYQVFVTLHDITNLKKTEEELIANKKRYSEIFDRSRDGFVMVDKNGEIIDANESYCTMLGYSLQELQELENFYKITPEYWHDWEKNEIWENRLLKTGYSGVYEKEYIRKDGSIFPVELESYMVLDEEGNIDYLWGVVRDITEKKKAEGEIKEIQQRYRSLFEESRDWVYLCDFKGNFIDANNAALEDLGYTHENLKDLKFEDIIVEKDLPKAFQMIENLLETHEQESLVEYRVKRKDGSIGYVESMASLVYKDKVPYAIQGIARDITNRKQAERAIRDNEQKFRELFNNALVGIAVHDSNGKMLAVNKTAENIFGLTEEELCKKDLSFWKGKLRNTKNEPLNPTEFPVSIVIKTKLPFESKIIGLKMDSNRKTRWFINSIRPILNENGNIEKIVATFLDITHQKNAEDAVQQSEHKFRSLVEQAAEMLFLHETNGKIVDVNKAAEKNTGYTRDELLNMNVFDIDPHAQDRNDLENYWKGLSAQDPPTTFEVYHKRKDGTLYPAEVTLSKVVIADKHYMLGLARDITQRKKFDEKIKREKKMLTMINNLNQLANQNGKLHEIIVLYENSIKDIFELNVATVYLVSDDKKQLIMQNLSLSKKIKDQISQLINMQIPSVSINLLKSSFYSSLLAKNEAVLTNDPDTIIQMMIEHTENKILQNLVPSIFHLVKNNSVMSVPMIVNNNPIGVLQISSEREFTESELERFKVIAEQFTDLIMRIKIEEALKKSEEQYRLLFNQVPTGVGIGSFDGDILRVNQVFCDMLGFSKKELLEIKIQELYVQEEKRKHLLQSIKKHGFVRDYEVKFRKKDGSIGDFLINSEIITYNDEKVLLTSVKEITFLKNTQKELEEAQQRLMDLNRKLEEKVLERTERIQQLLQQKDEFINQLGHDLKNPLGPFIQLLPLLDEHITDPKDKQIIDVLQRNARYMQNLVRKTIELAKLNSSKTHFSFEKVNLFSVVDDVISANHALFTNNDIIVQNNVPSVLPVYADQFHMQEVFMNLFNNAVKYTEGSGKITIDAKEIEEGVLISVKDTGIGIAEDDIPHLFEEYYKADPSRHDFDSSGLGLPICKRIIQRHHGKIWVESEGLGKGSTFYFTLSQPSD